MFARRELLRVEPGADAVVALAHVVDVRDAIDAQQLVPDVDRGEVAQVDVVVAAVGREEVDDHQDIGRLLADRDPLVLDRVGNCGMASATRFCTMTRAVFTSVPMSKVTVSVYVPSLPICEDM